MKILLIILLSLYIIIILYRTVLYTMVALNIFNIRDAFVKELDSVKIRNFAISTSVLSLIDMFGLILVWIGMLIMICKIYGN